MNGLKSVPEVSDCLEGMNFNSHNAYAKFPSKCLAGMCTFLSHWQELTVGIKCYFSIRWLCCVIAEKKILLVYKYVLFSLIEKAKYVHFRTFWKCIKVQKLKKKIIYNPIIGRQPLFTSWQPHPRIAFYQYVCLFTHTTTCAFIWLLTKLESLYILLCKFLI